MHFLLGAGLESIILAISAFIHNLVFTFSYIISINTEMLLFSRYPTAKTASFFRTPYRPHTPYFFVSFPSRALLIKNCVLFTVSKSFSAILFRVTPILVHHFHPSTRSTLKNHQCSSTDESYVQFQTSSYLTYEHHLTQMTISPVFIYVNTVPAACFYSYIEFLAASAVVFTFVAFWGMEWD